MSTELHVLNTGQSDCIILQSEGHLAMIDAGEDSDYPKEKPWLNYKGYEDKIVNYLFNNFKREDGKVYIDFIVATHSHSDHIGGFDTIINNPNIIVKKAYVKSYHGSDTNLFERTFWDNSEVYKQLIQSINQKGIFVKQRYDVGDLLGTCRIRFYNYQYTKPKFLKRGENTNSIVVSIRETITGTRLLLMSDLNYRYKFERKILKQLSRYPVDVLKVGHHGHIGSTPAKFLEKISPTISIVCGSQEKASKFVNWKLQKYSKYVKYTSGRLGDDLLILIRKDNDFERRCC